MKRWEREILDLIQKKGRGPRRDKVMKAISRAGDKGAVWLALTGAMGMRRKTRKTSTALSLALALDAASCNLVLKPLTDRLRPCDHNPSVPLLVERPTDASFPSGHTTAAFAVTTGLYKNGSKLWVPSLGMALLTATSRMYLYLHYPSDVVAGGLLGTFVGCMGTRINEKCWSKKEAAKPDREARKKAS